jgi:predicted branched-subunit amino acid permease
MSPVIGRGFARRTAAAHLTIDESTAVSSAQGSLRGQRIGFWVTGLVVYVGWNLTTLLGAVIGDLLGDVSAYGLDAAAAAAFLGLLWPRLAKLQAQAVAVAAAFVAALLTPVLMPGLPVLVAALVAVVFGATNWLGGRRAPGAPTGAP